MRGVSEQGNVHAAYGLFEGGQNTTAVTAGVKEQSVGEATFGASFARQMREGGRGGIKSCAGAGPCAPRLNPTLSPSCAFDLVCVFAAALSAQPGGTPRTRPEFVLLGADRLGHSLANNAMQHCAHY